MIRVYLCIGITIAPLIGWVLLYAAVRVGNAKLQPIVRWIRVLRWIAPSCALLLLAGHLVYGVRAIYGLTAVGFSTSLPLVESWARGRLLGRRTEAASN